jgi:uncharacterized membrane protein YhaH (DUF805 family)
MIGHIKNTLAALVVCVLVLGLGSLLDTHTGSARSLITLLSIMFASVVTVAIALALYVKQLADEVPQ